MASTPAAMMPRSLFPPRKIAHLTLLMFALLFPFLNSAQMMGCALLALLLTTFILPQLDVDLRPQGGEAAPAASHNRILAYPLSMLALVILYRHNPYLVAAVWGIMAL